jgi:flagellin
MSSINTNLSAMTALQALKATQSAMNKNQSQISTGLRVGEASHNASYWSIATSMKSDNGALGAVKDSIGQSKAMINTFTSAMDKSLTYLNKMKEGLVAASQPGADTAKIQTEFKANIEGMKSAAGSASFNGQNWLAGAGGQVDLVSSYDGVNNKVGTLSIDTAKTNLFANAATGEGGLLNDAAAIDISSVAPKKGVETAAKTDAVTTAAALTNAASDPNGGGAGVPTAGYVTFAAADLEFKAGNKVDFKGTDGTAQSYVMKDTDTDIDKLVASIGTMGGVTATKNGTDLRLTNAVAAEGIESASFTKASASSAGFATIKAADVEFKEGNKIQFRAAGGDVQTYTMKATDTDMDTLVASIGSKGGVTASKDVDGNLVLTSDDATKGASATFVSGEVDRALKSIDEAIAAVTEGSAMLGANKALLETQEEFIGVLSDSLTAGVSAFVDADMNEASTRNQALQTQQQLGVQALSMANQNSQMILRLFQ